MFTHYNNKKENEANNVKLILSRFGVWDEKVKEQGVKE